MAVAVSNRWYFTKEQIENTPSIRAGLDPEKELSYRQQAATLIQDMGQRLSVSQLTINTAIVYMHRFYMYHCFSKFHRNILAPCCLFLAAKVEEQPRKLEHVITVAHRCLHRGEQPLDVQSEEYMQKAQDLVENESILLQTLGFECTVHHPHTYVVKCIQLVRASKDLGQTSYFMATNSLHLTTLCLQFKPPVVACACIHLACKWSNWEIPQSSDNKNWWEYIDSSVNKDLLDDIAQEFIHILDKCPSRLKKKIHSGSQPIKLPRMESSSNKTSNSTSSGSSSATRTISHYGIDGAHNGIADHEAFTQLYNELEKGRQKDREKGSRDERSKDKKQELDKLKPLPAIASARSVGGSTAAVSTTVSLPPLLPLTTKYATVTAASQMPIGDAKVSTTVSSGSAMAMLSGLHHGKQKHHPQSDTSPAKKHKSSHAHRPHSSSHKLKTSDTSPASSKVPHSHKSTHPSHKISGHLHKPPQPHLGHHGAAPSHSLPHKSHSSHHHHTSSSHKTHHGHLHRPSSKSSADLAKKHSSKTETKSPAMELPPPPPPPVASGSSLPLAPTSSPLLQHRFISPATGGIQNPMTASPGQLPMPFVSGMFPGMLPGQMVPQHDNCGVNSRRVQVVNPFGMNRQVSPVVTGVAPPLPPPPTGPVPMLPPPPPPPPLP